ncbi:hypothetical protein Ddc_21144 [Ditylenchus destructor]|nr:hypothetical protein Ddc_21144 [Ditylenchus destructor]
MCMTESFGQDRPVTAGTINGCMHLSVIVLLSMIVIAPFYTIGEAKYGRMSWAWAILASIPLATIVLMTGTIWIGSLVRENLLCKSEKSQSVPEASSPC